MVEAWNKKKQESTEKKKRNYHKKRKKERKRISMKRKVQKGIDKTNEGKRIKIQSIKRNF